MKRFIPLLLLLAILGCSKDKDKENPVVTITSPAIGQTIRPGETIRVKGTVSDNENISEVHLRVTHAVTSAIFLEIDDEPNARSFNFDYTVGPAVAGTHYRIQVIAKDKLKNDGRSIVEFICN